MSRILLSVAILLSVVLLISCSDSQEPPTGPGDNTPDNAVTISVAPSVGVPGNPIIISGYNIDPLDTSVAVYVGDQPTVFLSDSSGVKALIPLFIDSISGWSEPPLGLQDVTIRIDSRIVAIAEAALQVDSLPHADGATETILQDFQVLSSSLQTIWSSLPEVPGDPRVSGYRRATLMMLDSILVAADSSITALIAGQSSWNNNEQVDLALIDAVLASSGALEFYNEAAASLGQITSSLRVAQAQGIFCKGGGADMDLACQMQIYVVLDNYATYFVKPTTTTYANTVGLAGGVIAISGVGLAAEAIIGALMVVFDFVYGTLAPSLFPAEITQFSLDVATDTIAINALTGTTIQIAAVNHPATIRATEILDKLLAALGLAKASKLAASFREVLVNAMKWALGLYRKGVVQFNNDSGGEIFIDPEADLPTLEWGPVTVTHSDLVELFSFTEDIITADPESFEWKGLSRGDGRIQARGRGAGEKSKVLYDNALCWGCVYTGGAFGENAPGTETKTVVVGKPAKMLVQITGLPTGIDANVIVSGAEYSSGRITATDSLSNLDPGDYHITAIEVQDGDGDKYIPSPIDTSVTLVDGDYETVTIGYDPEYGNLLLTVTGLPEGVDADIDIAGPETSNHHAVSDTLLDSLVAGSYAIAANDVLDLDGVTNLVASPKNQNITVIAGETAIANVTYTPEATMKVFLGSYDHALDYFSEGFRSMTNASCGSADGQTFSRDSIFVPNLSYGTACILEGGLEVTPGEVYPFSSSCGSGSASGSVSMTIQYGGSGKEIIIEASIGVSASAPPVTDDTPFAQYSASANASLLDPSTRLILQIANDDGKNLAFEITYSMSGSRSGDLGAMYGVGFMTNFYSLYNCTRNTAYWYLRPEFVGDGLSASGIDTVSLEHATLDHLSVGIHATGRASGTTYTDQDGEMSETRGGQASATCSYRLRLIELP